MINLMDYELVQLSDINGTVYDSGVIVKDFDPTNFTPPAEAMRWRTAQKLTT